MTPPLPPSLAPERRRRRPPSCFDAASLQPIIVLAAGCLFLLALFPQADSAPAAGVGGVGKDDFERFQPDDLKLSAHQGSPESAGQLRQLEREQEDQLNQLGPLEQLLQQRQRQQGRHKRALLEDAEDMEEEGELRPLPPRLKEFLDKYVLVKTNDGFYMIAEKDLRRGGPNSPFQLRQRRKSAGITVPGVMGTVPGAAMQSRERRLPSAERNFQLRVRKAMPYAQERNFQLRVRKQYPSAESNFQLRVRKQYPSAESNFQLRVRKALADGQWPYQAMMKKYIPAESNFQLRVRKSMPSSAERNFQLRVRKDGNSVAEVIPSNGPSFATQQPWMDDALNNFQIVRNPDDGSYYVKEHEKRALDNTEGDYTEEHYDI